MSTAAGTIGAKRHRLTFSGYMICMRGVMWREALRFIHQRGRFFAALVRPLVWLVIFAAGWRTVRTLPVMSPYHVHIVYSTYVVPGLLAMVQFFYGMQSSLSMVYDREMGNMRVLLVSPFPRWFLLVSRLTASTAISIIQCYAFLVLAWLWGVDIPGAGWITVLPALMLGGFMLGAMGMLLSSMVRQLENFAGVMNFVIFPMFFASSALYPLRQLRHSSPILYHVCQVNPFTYAVELSRFCLYSTLNPLALGVIVACTVLFTAGAILAYDPARGVMARRPGAAA